MRPIAEASFVKVIVPVRPERNGWKIAVIGYAGLPAERCRTAECPWLRSHDIRLNRCRGTASARYSQFQTTQEVIDRRMDVLKAEGIRFEMGVCIDMQKLPAGFDTPSAPEHSPLPVTLPSPAVN